jgi:hypothetical protein
MKSEECQIQIQAVLEGALSQLLIERNTDWYKSRFDISDHVARPYVVVGDT